MLDPVSALGIAAAAAQFLEFGTQLFSYSNELWKTGSTVGSEDLRKLTNDLVSLEGSIHKQLRTTTTQKALSEEEQALYNLATECANIAHKLETLIQKILRGDPKSRWRTFRAAFSTIWHRDDVELLAHRMGLYREQLALRILALLNANVTLQGESLEHLERNTKEIIEVLSINHNSMNVIAESHHTAAKEWHRDNADLAEMRHEEVLAAIITLKDGSSQTLRPNRSRSEPIPADRAQIHTASTYRRGSMHQKPGREPEPPGFIVSEFTQVPRQILDCLFFRALGDRQEVVAQSHGRTFDWLFDEDKQADSKWTNFTQWLISGRGCYWINGKAGSGKSTLMKFIASHSRTVKALRIWAGDEGLIKASFYFWNAGSTMQKSCSGLLRSLLFQIVEQDEGLIPILFPSLCRTALAHPHEPLSEPTMAELKKAFSILTSDMIKHQKLCLLVDGIDECDGDYLEVLELLERAGSSDRVKIVLSSRPIAACVDTLSSCAQLRLQDLTYEDVRLYVREKLSDHRLMKQLAKNEPAAASKLIDSITSKASGVFLWVILVVRSILEGLQNFDTIGDLEQRLDELPDSLAKLYQHMFDAMSVRYRSQGAFLFQLLLRSTEVQIDQPLSVQQLAFAVHQAPHDSLCASLRPLTIEEGRTQCRNMEGWMRSRCCGLVEAQDLPRSLEEATGSPKRMVGFLHRTVLEFLRTERVLGDIRQCTADDFAEPDLALLGSCLYEMKAESSNREDLSKVYCRAWSCMRNALAYCKVLQEKFGKSFRDYILEIDSVSISYWGEQWRTMELRTLRCMSLDLAMPNTLLLLSAFKGLTLFLKEETANITAGEVDMTKELLLIHCFKDFFGVAHQSSVFQQASDRLDLVADSIVTLLKQGANTNVKVFLSRASLKFGFNDHGRNTEDINKKGLWERTEGIPRLENESWFFPPEMSAGGEQTVWYLVLDQLFYYSGFAGALQLKSLSRHSVDLILSLLEQLILGGADVDATFVAQYRLNPCSRIPHVRLSAFAVLELFLSRLKSGACDKIRQLMFERKASICAWRYLAEDHPPARKTKKKDQSYLSLSHPLYVGDNSSTENMILCARDTDVETPFPAPSGSGKDASSGSLLTGKPNVAHTVQSSRKSFDEMLGNGSSVDKGLPSSRRGDQPTLSRSRRRKHHKLERISSQAKAHPTPLPSRRHHTGIRDFIKRFI